MSEDNTTSGQASKSWLEKIAQAFSDEPDSPQEILEILRTAEARQIIDSDSMSLIEGAMQVTDMQIREVMIPRSQMVTVKASQDPSEYIDKIIESAHSRFPVIGDNNDDVIGILLAKDLLALSLKGRLKKEDIIDILRPATIAPESQRLNQLLKRFRQNRNHMAIIVDEYGGIAGLVTIEDVLEQIVGEIEDEHDVDDEAMIKPLPSGEYIVKALTPVDDFNSYFGVKLDESQFDTIGGLVLKHFGRLPRRNEAIEFDQFRFKILNADNRSVRLLQVLKTA